MKNFSMILLFFILSTSEAFSFEWSVNDYIENCSVIHQKKINNTDKETIGYCIGVVKGALAGILVMSSIETQEMKIPECLTTQGRLSFFDIQKNILATMRLNSIEMESADQPNTANTAVAFALLQLYPCLLE